ALLRPGAKVQARSPAVPGTLFDGRVQALLPEVNAATRTLKARMELANPGGRLAPGMFVTMNFMDLRPEKALLVPSDAVIQTGKRTVVMLAEGQGHFRPVEVQAGIETNGQTEIKRGLQAGQRVVVSSAVLIDSGARLRGLGAPLPEASDDRAPDSLVDQQPLPRTAGHADGQRLGRVLGDEDTARRAAGPLRRAGDHPHDLPRPGATHRREPDHLSADDDDAVG